MKFHQARSELGTADSRNFLEHPVTSFPTSCSTFPRISNHYAFRNLPTWNSIHEIQTCELIKTRLNKLISLLITRLLMNPYTINSINCVHKNALKQHVRSTICSSPTDTSKEKIRNVLDPVPLQLSRRSYQLKFVTPHSGNLIAWPVIENGSPVIK